MIFMNYSVLFAMTPFHFLSHIFWLHAEQIMVKKNYPPLLDFSHQVLWDSQLIAFTLDHPLYTIPF